MWDKRQEPFSSALTDFGRKRPVVPSARSYGPYECRTCKEMFERETYNAKNCPGCRKKDFLSSSPMKG